MKRVIQKDASGCGIACVAMVAGVPYDRVMKVAASLSLFKGRKGFYTFPSELVALLAAFGIKSRFRWHPWRWSTLTSLSIAGIHYRESDRSWHWVVYVPDPQGGYVLDSRKRIHTERRRDFDRMTPFRYRVEVQVL